MYLTAEEMKARTQKNLNEIQMVFKKMESASDNGEFTCSISGRISERLKKFLHDELSYDVWESQNSKNSSVYTTHISWR